MGPPRRITRRRPALGGGRGGAPVSPDGAFAQAPASPAEPEALAFATDPDSERVLREGLDGFGEPQVWPGEGALGHLGARPGACAAAPLNIS